MADEEPKSGLEAENAAIPVDEKDGEEQPSPDAATAPNSAPESADVTPAAEAVPDVAGDAEPSPDATATATPENEEVAEETVDPTDDMVERSDDVMANGTSATGVDSGEVNSSGCDPAEAASSAPKDEEEKATETDARAAQDKASESPVEGDRSEPASSIDKNTAEEEAGRESPHGAVENPEETGTGHEAVEPAGTEAGAATEDSPEAGAPVEAPPADATTQAAAEDGESTGIVADEPKTAQVAEPGSNGSDATTGGPENETAAVSDDDERDGETLAEEHIESACAMRALIEGDAFTGAPPETESEEEPAEEEEEEEEEPVPEEEPQPVVPGGMYSYNVKEMCKQPKGDLDKDLLQMNHSYGYQCTRRANLFCVDKTHLMTIAGAFVNIITISKDRNIASSLFLPTLGGGTVGAIAVHPSQNYFAVAENGDLPLICIYTYPGMVLHRVLRSGTLKSYSSVNFSNAGDKLASVGGAPDYMLTVWDWKTERVILRSKAFSQDIFRVTFNPDDEGQLTTGGTGHIRFWKMTATFTGLKLHGDIGKFGRTELSDIAGYVELSDGKVLSGSEWGNMMLWEAGLIKCEVARKGGKKCHNGQIEQCFVDDGELITAGHDGFIRVWDLETIENADASDEHAVFEVEPMNELKIGSDVRILTMVRSRNPATPSTWYAQDGGGHLWELDLSMNAKAAAPRIMSSFHTGGVCGIVASPQLPLFASLGNDGLLRFYDYNTKTLVCERRFQDSGTAICRIPPAVDKIGTMVIVGFASGAVRCASASPEKVVVSSAFKPHSAAIVAMAFSTDGKTFVTASKDNSIFFHNVEAAYAPIGFESFECSIVSISWHPDASVNQLLVCCTDGDVFEVAAPQSGHHDVNASYRLNLHKRKFHYEPPLVIAQVEDEEKSEDATDEGNVDSMPSKIEDRAAVADPNGHADVEDDKVQLYSVTCCRYTPTGNIIMVLTGRDCDGKCFIFDPEEEDAFAEPFKTITIERETIVNIGFSTKDNDLLCSCADGTVQIVKEWGQGRDKPLYWAKVVHDGATAGTADVCTSFDEKLMITAGGDGNIFTFNIKEALEKDKEDSQAASKLTAGDLSGGPKEIPDDDVGNYSFEEAKQQAEEDKQRSNAARRKQTTIQQVTKLRSKFEVLMKKNEKLPLADRLTPEELDLNPRLRDAMEGANLKKIEDAKLEMAYEAEKARIARGKLEQNFYGPLEEEHVSISSFSATNRVSSFRVRKLSSKILEFLSGDTSAGGNAMSRVGARNSRVRGKAQVRSVEESLLSHEEEVEDLQTGKGKLSQAEIRKIHRIKRAREWTNLMARKPNTNTREGKDSSEITHAIANMGDFKLKTSDGYVVPESERTNVHAKRQQLLYLKKLIHDQKCEFNQEFNNLVTEKSAVAAEGNNILQMIKEIDMILSEASSVSLAPLQLESIKYKLHRFVDEETVREHRKQKELNKGNSANGNAHGFGGFGGGDADAGGGSSAKGTGGGVGSATAEGRKETSASSSSGGNQRKRRSASTAGSGRASSSTHKPFDVTDEHAEPQITSNAEPKQVPHVGLRELVEKFSTALTNLGQKHEICISLRHARAELIEKFRRIQDDFDNRLMHLLQKKLQLDIQFKQGELKLILLSEELRNLKEFEKRDNELSVKLDNAIEELEEIDRQVLDINGRHETRRLHQDQMRAKVESVENSFHYVALDQAKHAEFLTKVFRKKVKRVKKHDGDKGDDESAEAADGDGNGGESEESDEDDDDDDDLSEDDDDDDFRDDVLPAGLEQKVWDQVVALRTQRVEAEDDMAIAKKAYDTIHKEQETLNKRLKGQTNTLLETEAAIERFQNEKQQRLNQLDIVITLRMDQINFFPQSSKVPKDLGNALIFNSKQVDRLKERIKELQLEKQGQKKHHRELKLLNYKLTKTTNTKEIQNADHAAKVESLQMLKFGQILDLERLDKMSVNKTAEELQQVLEKEERVQAKMLKQWDMKINSEKDHLTEITKRNTAELHTLADLTHQKHVLESSLNSIQHNASSDMCLPHQPNNKEQERLVRLVQIQQHEIAHMRKEIDILCKKGGALRSDLSMQ